MALTPLLRHALSGNAEGLPGLVAYPCDDTRDQLSALIEIHALHTAPLPTLHGAEWLQHDPSVAALKARLEQQVLERLERDDQPPASSPLADPVAAMRTIARRDAVPPVYEWLAHDASFDQVVEFIAIEGGPDAGFDDFVALCQVGISGVPKLALGTNYWDEMGRGTLADVHTALHGRLVRALDLPTLAIEALPLQALERAALNGVLVTNRAFQPELVGALGLLELQAGPRCRRVVTALQRIGAPADALPFYEEHAVADPRHGKDWLTRVVGPLAVEIPSWGPRMVRGARWRSAINTRLFAHLAAHFAIDECRSASWSSASHDRARTRVA